MTRTIRNGISRLALTLVMTFATASVVTTATDVAIAQQPKWKLQKEAKASYSKGKKKMDAGDYAGALEHFKQADATWPGAAPKYNIAVCYDKLGKNAEAVAAYRTFIDSKPGAKYADRVIAAGKRVTELETMLEGTVTVGVNPSVQGVVITVDGVAQQGTELTLSPGPHTIEVSAPGYDTFTQTVEVKGGEVVNVPVTMNATAKPDPVEQDSGGNDTATALRISGFVALGIGVVGGALTAAFGVQALGAQSDFDNTPTTELADDAEDNALLSDVFLGIGGAFGIAGIILLGVGYSMDDDGGADSAWRVTPMAGPQGGGVAVTVDF